MKKKTIILALIIIGIAAFLLFKGITSLTGKASSSTCGNNICETGENFGNCLDDCPTMCGNDICETGENITCNIDCIDGTEEIQEDWLTNLFSWIK